MSNEAILLAFISIGGSVIVALISLVANRRAVEGKARSDEGAGVKAISEGAATLMDKLQEDNDRLRKENAELRQLLNNLEEVQDLEERLEKAQAAAAEYRRECEALKAELKRVNSLK